MNYTVETFIINNPKNSLRAYGSLLVEVNATTTMKIKGFKIFEGRNGLFCKPPQTKGKNKEGEEQWFNDIQFVDTTETNAFREEVYGTFIKEYSKQNNSTSNSKSNAASSQSNYSNSNKQKTTKPLW